VLGLDENDLAVARATNPPRAAAADDLTRTSCQSPPCEDISAATVAFAAYLQRQCASLLAVAGAARLLQGALDALGVQL